VTNSYGRELNRDLNINPVLFHQFSKKVSSSLRGYATVYNGSQQLHFKEIPDSAYVDEFRQNFYRLEDQTDINFEKATLTVGAGYSIDQARSTRYDYSKSVKQNEILYGFAQQEWRPTDRMTIIAGFRYDDNKLFAGAFSPKLALRYKVSPKLSLNASAGRGFKAPDFRQLYLNFTNNAAGGYSVFGTIDAVKIISAMQQSGLIAEIKEDYYKLSTLTPEFSTGLNAGANWHPSEQISVVMNFFRNDVENLIDVRQVATKNNGSQVFSYINVKKAYTQGVELEMNWKPLHQLTISSGYQSLETADKDELKSVKEGKLFTRDNNGYSRLLTKNEYAGLPNRSQHMANIKFKWENEKKWYATARFAYRSKWAVADKDGNGIYNKQDEFANGFVQVNISAGREWSNGVRLQAGMDNVLNYRDINYLPNLQGRMLYLGLQYEFFKNKR
jgi:outer membrane receptor for ferrienterochelin and colicins